jgi:hypothetical protein
MQNDVGESTFADTKNVYEDWGELADFVSVLASDGGTPESELPRAQAGATSLLIDVESALTAPADGLPDGNLSDWLTEEPDRWGLETLKQMLKICRLIADPENARIFRETCEEMKDELDKFTPQFKKRDFSPMNLLIKKLGQKVGINGDLELVPNSKMLRVTQAEIKCLTLHRTPLRKLVEKAKKGEQGAVLQLIKVDSLFLRDSCTAAVIQEALTKKDRWFLNSMASALRWKFKFTKKDNVRVMIYIFCGLDIEMPYRKLRNLLDPSWNKFKELSFDQFVVRCRREIREHIN